MEEIGILVGFAFVITLVVVPIWLITTVVSLRRRAETEERENTRHWQDLTARIHRLETQIKDLRQADVKTPAAAPDTSKLVGPSPLPLEEAPVAKVPATDRVPETVVQPPVAKPPISPAAPTVSVSARPANPPSPTYAPPPSLSGQSAPRFQPAARSGWDLEEMLGTNWLSKIGVGMIVLGLAFFIGNEIQKRGPLGKVAVGVSLSALMIAAGVRYEPNARYRILARASAAGGWALLFFVSYAIYHVPAAKIIDSRELDFLLMMMVAAAIVGYSLRYKSQTTTALALVLSYLTVGIHHTSIYSLAASVVLALTVVGLAWRMQWFALELFGIAATYFNHLLWLWPVIEGMGPNRAEFPEFRTSVGLLASYWLLFRMSYIYRRIASDSDEYISAAAALLNGFFLLGLLRYQSIHPEWAFWTLLALGGIELGLSLLAARRRRPAFLVLATLGSALLVAAIPFRYSGSSLSLLWLVGAEVFLLVGIFLREIVFRRIGMITMAIVSAQMVFDPGMPLLEERAFTKGNVFPAYSTATLFAVGAVLCYLNAHWIRARWSELFKDEFDFQVMGSMSYVGGLLLLLAAWFAVPGLWTAVIWAVLALAFGIVAQKLFEVGLAVQGNLIAVCAIIRLVTLNLSSADQWHGFSLRLITVGATALLLYAAAPFARSADSDEQGPWALFTAGYTWAASILLGMLVWYEVDARNVAVGWMMLGLVLLEIGLRLDADFLLWQGFSALGCSFVRLFVVNLDVFTAAAGERLRILRVLMLAVGYLFASWRLRMISFERRDANMARASAAFSYFGVITVASLIYVELKELWVAAGWAALALVLLAAAQVRKRLDCLHQSMVLAIAVSLRLLLYNYFQPFVGGVSFWESQSYFAGVAIALLFAGLPFAFLLRRDGVAAASEFAFDRRPEQVYFFIPFALLTLLIALASAHNQMTVNWSIEGVIVFLLAIAVGERSFRLAGLGVLLGCVAKILLIDVWNLHGQSRYITLMALGAALVLVSYLYTRYREKLRQYL